MSKRDKKQGGAAGPEALKGWQQIAAFLGHPAAVVQRWASEGMPVHREGRHVVTTADDLNAWLGKQSGKPVSVATQNTDLAAELKRGLAFFKKEKSAKAQPKKAKPPMNKPTIRVTKWLGDIPVEATCTACPGVSFKAQGSSHRPNREEYQRSLQSQFDAHCKTEHGQQA